MRLTFNQQRFFRILGLFAILDLCLLTTACGDWESQAIQIISLLGPAIQAVIAILAAVGVNVPPVLMQKFRDWSVDAQNILLTVKGLILDFKAADASAQPGILNQIQIMIQVITSKLSEILPELHITNPDSQHHVLDAFAAISGFIVAVLALLPAIKPQMSLDDEKKLGAKAQEAVKDFKKHFNTSAGYFGKQYEI